MQLSKEKKPPKIEPRKSDDELDTDYQYARENYYNVIERGHDALDELLMEAKENGNARMYEVVGQLIKVIGDQNQNLLGLHQQVKTSQKKSRTFLRKLQMLCLLVVRRVAKTSEGEEG